MFDTGEPVGAENETDDAGLGVGAYADGVAMVAAGLDVLARAGAWRVSDAEVGALVVQLEVLARRVAAVQLGVVAEGIGRGLPVASGAGTGGSAPGRWVRSLIAVTPGDAGRRAQLAQALFGESYASEPDGGDLAPTRKALCAGAISTAHAGHIVAALAQLKPPATPAGVVDAATQREAQALLVAFAAGSAGQHALDPTQLATAGRVLTATLDPAGGERLAKDEDRQAQLRTVTLAPLPCGMFHLSGLLTALVGHKLFTALHAFAAPRPGVDGTPDPRTAGMRLHDGLDHVADLVLTCPDRVPAAHGAPTRLVLNLDAATLLTHIHQQEHAPEQQHPATLDTSPGPASPQGPVSPQGPATLQVPQVLRVPRLPGGWPLAPLSAQMLACDSDLVAVLTGTHGSPLDVADTIYPFTTKQRAAIIARDQHCTFGACTAPAAWCHIHHVQAHSRGGPTSVDNATLLCGTHHRHVHALQLTGTRTRDGTITWHAPVGPCPAQPPPAIQHAIHQLATRWSHRAHQRGSGTAKANQANGS